MKKVLKKVLQWGRTRVDWMSVNPKPFGLFHFLELTRENGRKLNGKWWSLISWGGSLCVPVCLSNQASAKSLVFKSLQHPTVLLIPRRSLARVIKHISHLIHVNISFPLYLGLWVEPSEAIKGDVKIVKINTNGVESEWWRCVWCFWLMLEPIWTTVIGKRWG